MKLRHLTLLILLPVGLAGCATNFGHDRGPRAQISVTSDGSVGRYYIIEMADYVISFPSHPETLSAGSPEIKIFFAERIPLAPGPAVFRDVAGDHIISFNCGGTQVFQEQVFSNFRNINYIKISCKGR